MIEWRIREPETVELSRKLWIALAKTARKPLLFCFLSQEGKIAFVRNIFYPTAVIITSNLTLETIILHIV